MIRTLLGSQAMGREGTMTMRIRIICVIAALFLTGTAFAAASDFGVLDRDGNGYIERAEIEGTVPEILKKYDLNGDGGIDRQEFQAAGGVPPRFDLLDRDKSGLLDLDELKQTAAARFKKFDANRDGRIDTSEWKKLKKPVGRPVIILFYF